MATLKTFTCFNKLRKEIRYMIWGLALPDSWIVHLTRRQVATDKNPVWWKRVWSGVAVDEPDYDLVNIEETWIDDTERKIAAKLLVSEDPSWAWMSQVGARALLQRKRPLPRAATLYPGDNCPKKLDGFSSETPAPDLLF